MYLFSGWSVTVHLDLHTWGDAPLQTKLQFRMLLCVDFPFTQSLCRTYIRFQPSLHLDLNTWEDALP